MKYTFPIKVYTIIIVVSWLVVACTKRDAGPTFLPSVELEVGDLATLAVSENDASRGYLISIEVDPVLIGTSPQRYPTSGIQFKEFTDSHYELMSSSGARWNRLDVRWARVETELSARNWEAFSVMDTVLAFGSGSGIYHIGIIGATPSWALKEGFSCGANAPDKLEAFGQFVFDLARRYSAPPFDIDYWEIYNEPDVLGTLGCWGDPSDPYYGGGYYAEMLKVAYPQIKAANPEAQVMVGGLLLDCDPDHPPEDGNTPGAKKDCTSARFLEGILRNGGGDFFDGVGFHGYDYYLSLSKYFNGNWHSSWDTTGPVLLVKAQFIRSLLEQYGVEGKFLANTEVGLVCGRSGEEPECQAEDFQNTKAYYLAQAYAAAQAEGLVTNIWYSLTGWRASGLVNAALEPLPAYRAFQVSAEILKDKAFVRALDDHPELMGYVFAGNESQVWLLWSKDGNPHQVQFDCLPAAVYDVFGQALPLENPVNLDVAPLYLEWIFP